MFCRPLSEQRSVMEGEEALIHFNCFVHYPSFTEEGLEVETVARGNGIQLPPSTQLSSLAASVLSDMFQKQEIDGKIIMKADNAKGQWISELHFVWIFLTWHLNFVRYNALFAKPEVRIIDRWGTDHPHLDHLYWCKKYMALILFELFPSRSL